MRAPLLLRSENSETTLTDFAALPLPPSARGMTLYAIKAEWEDPLAFCVCVPIKGTLVRLCNRFRYEKDGGSALASWVAANNLDREEDRWNYFRGLAKDDIARLLKGESSRMFLAQAKLFGLETEYRTAFDAARIRAEEKRIASLYREKEMERAKMATLRAAHERLKNGDAVKMEELLDVAEHLCVKIPARTKGLIVAKIDSLTWHPEQRQLDVSFRGRASNFSAVAQIVELVANTTWPAPAEQEETFTASTEFTPA